jgi:outer membrane protein assembly factor BamB
MWNSTVTRCTDFASTAKGNNMPKVHVGDLSRRQKLPIGMVEVSFERSPMRLHQLLCSSLCAIVFTTAELHAEDWTQFLGTQRNGVSSEKNLISEWPADGPKIKWRTPLGVSMSSVIVNNGQAFTLFQDESDLYTVALDAATGEEIWRTKFAPAYENAMGNGPRATPTVADGKLFVFTGEGILAAFNVKDGKELWKVNVPSSLKGEASEYGMSCSPLVVGNMVVVHTGNADAAVAAFDAKSGKNLWKSATGKAGYSSPVLMTLAGKEQIVTLTADAAFGVEATDGKVLWKFPFPTEYDCNTACPVQLGESEVLISAGENHGSAVLQISGKEPKFSAEEVWSSYGKDSQLRAEWQTPVIHDGHLYGLDNSGSAGPITNLVCIRLKDHETVWQKARFGKSNLILADGKLFLTTMNGEVVIVEASPKEFKELGRATIMETTRQAPTLSNGFLFVRDDKDVLCVDVRAK